MVNKSEIKKKNRDGKPKLKWFRSCIVNGDILKLILKDLKIKLSTLSEEVKDLHIQYIKAIVGSKGNSSIICTKLKCTVKQLNQTFLDYPVLQEIYDDERERHIDTLEELLDWFIFEEGLFQALKYKLNAIAQHRGYGQTYNPNQFIKDKTQVPSEIKIVTVTELPNINKSIENEPRELGPEKQVPEIINNEVDIGD